MLITLARIREQFPIRDRVTYGIGENKKTEMIKGYTFENGSWYIEFENGGSVPAAELQRTVKRNLEINLEKALSDTLLKMCMLYCKYSVCYDDVEELHERHCYECPLKKLIHNKTIGLEDEG